MARKQRGMVLIVALVFLTVMTLIGVSALKGSAQQERMVGNARQRSQAFHATEAALTAAEITLQATTLPLFDNSTPGLRQQMSTGNCDLSTFWVNGYCWSGVASVDCSTTPPSTLTSTSCTTASQFRTGILDATLEEQPRYVIEQLSNVKVSGSSVKFGPNTGSGYYRITARGLGGTQSATVILQSTFRR
ncbi:type IV pilus assembly protein PilX [Gammaproteobacteria bacterium]